MDINTLLTVPSKNMGFNKALHMLAGKDTLDLTDPEYSNTIRWLIQKAAQKEKASVNPKDNHWKLASLFRANKDVRYYLNMIHATGSHLVASNGHVLIQIENNAPPGFYSDTGILLEGSDYAKFPDFNRIMGTVNKECPIDYLKGETGSYSTKTSAVHYRKLTAKTSGTQLASAYYLEYLNILKRIGIKTAYLCESCLYFEGEGFKGLIMPMRID
ncbi:MAG: hypothetical protein KGI54_08255 [Pseudomonadota bacterium]|nr:hypothetical protein [Pseudomonadota bacterium]